MTGFLLGKDNRQQIRSKGPESPTKCSIVCVISFNFTKIVEILKCVVKNTEKRNMSSAVCYVKLCASHLCVKMLSFLFVRAWAVLRI